MEMKTTKVCNPIVLSMCMGAWLLAGTASHAADSRLYPAVGCQESFPDHDAVLNRNNGFLESVAAQWVTCPIVTDANSTRITVTVFYEAALFVPPNSAGKPPFFSCEILGWEPVATSRGSHDGNSVNLNVRNNQVLSGSFTMSMESSHQFTHLACYLLATKNGFSFDILGYRVDES
jgi:hypothetical protein